MGSGVTHTVIVAPTQGVLRFVPFVVNASVGDTIIYKWGAGPHTVTKSSELTICNKSMDADTFTSGPQNATFQFDVQVNDTNPLFYYCGVATHCEKGMFGIVNPPNGGDPTMTLGSMMPSLCSNDSSLSAMWSYTQNATAGTSAENWGSSYDMSGMPSWAHGAFAENVMYQQLVAVANPSIDISQLSTTSATLNLPDMSAILASSTPSSAAAGGYGAPATSGSASPSASAPAGSSSATSAQSNSTNGAGSIASSGAMIALIAIAASFMML